jgi:hypothetical protein
MQIAVSKTSQGFVQLPLCVSYEAVHIALVTDSPAKSSQWIGGQMVAGYGLLRDGQQQVLGVSPAQVLGSGAASLVAIDLADRGLERIGLLLNSGLDELQAALLSAYPSVAAAAPFHPVAELLMSVALPGDRALIAQGLGRVRRAQSVAHAHALLDGLAASSWRGAPVSVQLCRAAIAEWQAVYALSRRARERVRRFEDETRVLQQGVSRALSRHGPFGCAEAAAAFAEAWLGDALRRRQRREVVARHRAALAAVWAG